MSAARIAAGILAVLFFVAIASAVVPLAPAMPNADLGASWSMGMNEATARHLAFGKDIAFTFGPLSAIFTHFYDPAIFGRVILFSMILSISASFAAFAAFASAGLIAPIIYVITIALYEKGLDAILIFLPFMSYFAIRNLNFIQENRRYNVFITAACLVPISLVGIIKGTFLIAAIFALVFIIVDLLMNKRYISAIYCTIFSIFIFIVTWLVMGQNIDYIYFYVQSMIPVVAGYTEAMETQGPAWHILVYLFSCFVILSLFLAYIARNGVDFHKIIEFAALSIFLFLCFKAGFVRHDAHALAASSALVLCTLPLILITKGMSKANKWHVALTYVVILSSAAVIQNTYVGNGLSDFYQRAKTTFISPLSELATDLTGRRSFDATYEASMARIKADYPIKKMQGTSDIYSFDQAQLLASGNKWNPRPILQSYSVYEPELSRMNGDHLLGKDAPDNLLFAVQPIDGRLPSLEDAASWPAFLSHYRLSDYDGTYAYLRRRTSPLDVMGDELSNARERLGQAFDVPPSAGAVFAKINVKPTFAGRLARALFKIPDLRIKLTLVDGSTRTYRTISTIMDTGFVVSPLVSSTEDFLYFVSGNEDALGRQDVKSISITPAMAWFPAWQDSFEATFYALKPHKDALPKGLVAQEEEGFTPVHRNDADCTGVIDFVNGEPFSQTKQFSPSRFISVRGWLAGVGGSASVPRDISVDVSFSDGSRKLYEARRTARPDVKVALGKPQMADVGYSARIELHDSSVPTRLRIDVKSGQDVTICRNLEAVFRDR